MEQFKREDFEKLASVQSDYCVSIFIPTHKSGVEVNEGKDQINFKNQIQKIQLELESIGYRNLSVLLKPAYDLLDDNSFWKEQEKGLAVFFSDQMFHFFRVPISLTESTFLSTSFILTPMLPLLIEEDEFYTLSLSQNKIRLFRNTTFTFEEIDISDKVPENAEEVFSFYEFKKGLQGKNLDPGTLGTPKSKGNIIFHSHNPADDEEKYIAEFLLQVNEGIADILKNKKSPLVVAAVDNIFSIYRSVNTYKHLSEEFVPGNPDLYREKDLHDKSYSVVKSKLNITRKKDLEKYPVWAGTGKTSYDLKDILDAAHEGRIESLFIEEGQHLWGTYNHQERSMEEHTEKKNQDICLFNLAAAKTIENSGKSYEVTSEEMPEKNVKTKIAAVFRY